jgi:N-acetylmuramoyl-L-alanine amidase
VILPLVWLLSAVQPAPMRVRTAEGAERVVQVVASARGVPAVRADQLAAALGGSVRTTAGGAVRLTVLGQTFDFAEDMAFARTGGSATVTLPLVDEAYSDGGRFWIPQQFATDVAPRYASGLTFDRARRELRVFGTVARRAPAAVDTPPTARTVPREPVTSRSQPAPDIGAASRGATDGRRTVVIDAGHGGPDAGMSGPLGGGPRVREKDVTLAVAHRLREVLAARGVTVVMTRTKDTLIALADRGRIANQRGWRPVRVHTRECREPRLEGSRRGARLRDLLPRRGEDRGRAPPRGARERGGPLRVRDRILRADPLSFILSDMKQNEYLASRASSRRRCSVAWRACIRGRAAA